MKNKYLVIIIIILLVVFMCFKEDNKVVVHLEYEDKELVLNMDDYLTGVVGMEMPASFDIEAIKAQVVASRSFAMSKVQNNTIYTNTKEQAYASNEELKEKWQDKYSIYIDKIKKAIEETENIVMFYNNQIIKSYYYSMSNGYSENSKEVFNEELPYIEVVDSSFDQYNKNFQVTKSFSYDNFYKLLNIPYNDNLIITNIKRDITNRVTSLTINNNTFKGTDIRKLLSLRSTDFNINILNDNIEITTKGYGHGVGMSQYGANYLASKGYNYKQILNYYYKNIEIKCIK